MQSRRRFSRFGLAVFLVGAGVASAAISAEPAGQAIDGTPLPGTAKLDWPGDIASRLVDSVDRFLLKELDKSIAGREKHWKRDFSSPAKYNASIEPNRRRLAHILGVRDPRVAFDDLEAVATIQQPSPGGNRRSWRCRSAGRLSGMSTARACSWFRSWSTGPRRSLSPSLMPDRRRRCLRAWRRE